MTTESWFQRYCEWEERSFPAHHLRWHSALAFVVLPGLVVPFLPESDFAIPVFGALWLMTASGAVGGLLIDVARRTGPKRHIGQVLAQVVLGLIGLIGLAAGVACLSLVIRAPEPRSWQALTLFLGIGASLIGGAAYLLHAALRGGNRGIR